MQSIIVWVDAFEMQPLRRDVFPANADSTAQQATVVIQEELGVETHPFSEAASAGSQRLSMVIGLTFFMYVSCSILYPPESVSLTPQPQ